MNYPQIENQTYESSADTIELETLQQQYNTALISYKQAYQTLSSAFQNKQTNAISNYIANVENWSVVLNSINNKIISILKRKDPFLNDEIYTRQTQNNNLNTSLQQLMAEHKKVNNYIDDYQSFYIGKAETEVNVHQNYMKYIFYLVICIAVFLLFIKVVFFSKSSQSGGGSRNTKLEDIVYLLSLMIVFLGLGVFFKENAGFIIVILILIFYILIKMKMIPNFLRI